jgi:hypothetical protein
MKGMYGIQHRFFAAVDALRFIPCFGSPCFRWSAWQGNNPQAATLLEGRGVIFFHVRCKEGLDAGEAELHVSSTHTEST